MPSASTTPSRLILNRGHTPSRLFAAMQCSRIPVRSSRTPNAARSPRCQVPYREAATPCPQPCPQPCRGVAHFFLMRIPASIIDRAAWRTVEASRPEWANPPAGSSGFPLFAPFAPSALRSFSGLAIGAYNCLGRFRGRNLVGLDRQSKCFFSYLQCGSFMARVARPWRGRCLRDRAALVNLA